MSFKHCSLTSHGSYRYEKLTQKRVITKNITKLLSFLIIGLLSIFIIHQTFYKNEKRNERSLLSGLDVCEESVIFVLPYLAGLLYSFVGVAIVCDKFFEPSLTEISEKLELSEDVAGATFMAAGSSAPELFTSLLDAFGPSNSIGIGTIVGSAMFNILIIIALSATVTNGAVELDWRPIVRDAIFYLISILLLVFFVILSGNYCFLPKDFSEIISNETWVNGVDLMENNDDAEYFFPEENEVSVIVDGLDLDYFNNDLFEDFIDVHCHYGEVGLVAGVVLTLTYFLYILFMVFNKRILSRCGTGKSPKVQSSPDDATEVEKQDEEEEEEDENIFSIPEKPLDKVVWALNFPLEVLFYFTIPNCEEEEMKKYYLVSFTSCIIWMATLSFVMVTLASRIGCLIGISSVVMGMTILAAGTSVPDALASMAVARKGMADMAIANAVGSNVFDILLGLGIPWALAEVILQKRTRVERAKVGEYIFILLGTLFLYLISIILNGWKMSKPLSYFYVSLYALFLLYILVTEL